MTEVYVLIPKGNGRPQERAFNRLSEIVWETYGFRLVDVALFIEVNCRGNVCMFSIVSRHPDFSALNSSWDNPLK